MVKDLSKFGLTQTAAPVSYTNNGTESDLTAVDGFNCEAVEHVINVGAHGGTLSGSLYFDIVLEYSDDNSTFYEVTDENDIIRASAMEDADNGIVKAVDAPADASQIYRVTYIGSHRYSRISLQFTGNHSAGVVIGNLAILHYRQTGDLDPNS